MIRATRDKERESTRLESESAAANRRLNQAETTLSHLKAQVKAKQEEANG
jgi:predicted  nucleic acid-binding Zn-ribbon protein